MTSDDMSRGIVACRVCRAFGVATLGMVEFYIDYSWPIYECSNCGCIFTLHDSSAYELLYSETSSCYNRYIAQSSGCKKLFDTGDADGLRKELSASRKYAFVIDEIAHAPKSTRLLEIGASRGHLTSWFILEGYPVTGVDVSPTAVASATAAFGDHFRVVGDASIDHSAPYDIVFHVGTIGCVEDPIGMTRDLLSLLRPGGKLLFNAPNRAGLAAHGQLWVEGAPPPDLVTMFQPGFWQRFFSDLAHVTETVEMSPQVENLIIGLHNAFGRKWRPPVPIPLASSANYSAPEPKWGDGLWRLAERVLRRLAPRLGLTRLAPKYPAEYGLFVQMIKK